MKLEAPPALPLPAKNRASRKIIPYDHAAEFFTRLHAQGKTVVQCHGTFDLIHPGHIAHFEEAKALGSVLVVTATSERFVNKGPGRPYFNDELRARWLSALACVDYVVLIPHAAAVEAIECVRPDIYCKGKEYADADHDVTGNIHGDIEAVRRCGGEIRYVGSVVFSSSRLLNQHFDSYPEAVKAFCRSIAKQCPPARFREIVDRFQDLRVLIIGDIIFDRYTTLEVQGLTSKSRILSGRFVSEELQAGGALAVYRHVCEFTPQVKLISLAGAEPWLDEAFSKYIRSEDDGIIRAPDFTTVVKQRFVAPRQEGREVDKLFSVNYIDAKPPSKALQAAALKRIATEIDRSDLVLVMDFGHGVLEDSVRECVQRKARFLAVNCQTNSNNHGFNILNRRYQRADSFTLDQTEINLAVGRRHIEYDRELGALATDLRSTYAWLTRGATQTLGWHRRESGCACVPFERSVVDTLGAGDAFCAAASLAAASGLPLPLATFMGQLAGAQAVKIVGNSEPIRKARFLKGAEAMLAF
jgi:cytidyltransferase-like protein